MRILVTLLFYTVGAATCQAAKSESYRNTLSAITTDGKWLLKVSEDSKVPLKFTASLFKADDGFKTYSQLNQLTLDGWYIDEVIIIEESSLFVVTLFGKLPEPDHVNMIYIFNFGNNGLKEAKCVSSLDLPKKIWRKIPETEGVYVWNSNPCYVGRKAITFNHRQGSTKFGYTFGESRIWPELVFNLETLSFSDP